MVKKWNPRPEVINYCKKLFSRQYNYLPGFIESGNHELFRKIYYVAEELYDSEQPSKKRDRVSRLLEKIRF